MESAQQRVEVGLHARGGTGATFEFGGNDPSPAVEAKSWSGVKALYSN